MSSTAATATATVNATDPRLRHDDVTAPPAPLPPASHGLPLEIWRFSAGLRVIIAMLCTVLLFSEGRAPGPFAVALLIAYDLWVVLLLWAQPRFHLQRHALLHCWIDASWVTLMLHATSGASAMLVITLVPPTVLASIACGVRNGVLLAVGAAAAILLEPARLLGPASALPFSHAATALAVLTLGPAAAVLARSMSVLHQHRQFVARIVADFDPRRGLDATAERLARLLRQDTGAQVAGLLLPAASGAPAWLNALGDGSLRAGAELHARLEQLLEPMPASPVSHTCRHGLGLLGGARMHGPGPLALQVEVNLDKLATLLEVHSVIVVPLQRYGQRHGHLLLGLMGSRPREEDVAALAHAAPELLRLVETASLIDRLQEETAAHERARIGRDLHDSAIQPYLGLKYAVQSLARNASFENSRRAELDALSELVDREVGALRGIIGGLRGGGPRGDNALVPAVRRQARRFAQLFGVDVQVDCPDELPLSRALAGALFHMVNEALNNVRKHTPARRVRIGLERVDGAVQLRVRDDGGSVRGRRLPPFRPASLTERATELGGTLEVSCPDGLDTELLIRIPLHPPDPQGRPS